jgi:hypothetical protein
MRAAVDHLFREGHLLTWGIPATGVLVETLLDRGADGDVAEAEAATERLAVAPERLASKGISPGPRRCHDDGRAGGTSAIERRRLTRLLVVLDDLWGVLLGLLFVLGSLLLSFLVLFFGLLLGIVFSLLFVLFVLKLRLLVILLLLLLLLFFVGVVVRIGVVHQHNVVATKVGAGGRGRSNGRRGWRGARSRRIVRRNPLIGRRVQCLQRCGCDRGITFARPQDMDRSEKGDDGRRGEHCLQEAAAPTPAPARPHVTNVESSFDICGHKSLWLARLC